MTTRVHDGVQQRFDFTSTFASGEKKEKYENGINRRIDRTLQEEKMRNIITELSREMIAWKRQWLELARTNEQYKREDKVEDYQRTIERTENMMIELDSFFYLVVPLIDSNMILA